MDPNRLKAFAARFLAQVEETMPRITRGILALERATSGVALRPIFDGLARDLHGLKGTAAMLGLKGASDLAHRMEDVVVARRGADAALGSFAADRLLEACDAVLAIVRAGASGEAPPDAGGLLQSLDEAVRRSSSDAPESPPGRRGRVASDRPRMAVESSGWRVTSSQIEGLLRAMDRIRGMVQRVSDHAKEAQACVEGDRGGAGARLGLLARGLTMTARDAGDSLQGLDDALWDLAAMPVAVVLEPLHRAVRELCRQLGKEGRLAVVGGDHAIERRLLEAVSPLIGHLVRNAVDHGLEPPSERERAGKDAAGSISVRIDQQGNLVLIEVADDGAGIDGDLLGRRAVTQGLLTEEALAALGPQQVVRLVFEDGLSTRGSVTETSGRGVGLAAVRREVERLGGHVDVSSRRGQGARFVIVVPAALGSTPVVVVRVEGRSLAFPLGAVETAKSARPGDFVQSARGFTLAHNDERIDAYDLGSLLGLREPSLPRRGQPVFVVGTTAGRAAITVDDVLGDREVVLRALPVEFRDVPAYHGVGVLAQRELVLVCNPEWLVHPHAEVAAAASRPPLRRS